MPARWAIVPFSLIESYMPKNGVIIDLGTGEGVMATHLALSSSRRRVIGLDLNRQKVYLAKRLTKNISNITFEVKDATKGLPGANGFVLSDFLHHVPKSKHGALLKSIYNSLNAKGVMVIKEIDTNNKLRARISRIFDFMFYPNETINFLNADSLIRTLTKIGFKVEILNVKKWFPGSTVLFICQKR